MQVIVGGSPGGSSCTDAVPGLQTFASRSDRALWVNGPRHQSGGDWPPPGGGVRGLRGGDPGGPTVP